MIRRTAIKKLAAFAALALLVLPATALADNTLLDGSVAAAVLMDGRTENAIERELTAESTANFPERFDLRDLGVVTPVKYQYPWGTCWGFAAIAAAETSILSEMGKTYEETGLDLSEHHLAYFARTPIDDGSSQDGEGVYVFDESRTLNTGALMFTATSLFSSGIGVATEGIFPYRGKNSITDSRDGQLNVGYSMDDDWSIDSQYRFYQAYQLENSEILPSPAVFSKYYASEEGYSVEERTPYYEGYDQRATDIMKEKLMEGKAISLAFKADASRPAQAVVPVYINLENNLWTHYTYDAAEINHGVTVVGWDDSIKAEDFLDHSSDQWGDGLAHQPEGDGAWIVKNSWGAQTESFPNYTTDWGIKDENGNTTGYFYLSYYDRSIALPEVFDFDVSGNKRVYTIDQYDYMPQDNVHTSVDSRLLKRANVFTAGEDQTLFAVSCENALENADVKYEIYLLDSDAVTPTDGTLKATFERHYEFPGFHRENLDTDIPLKAGDRYSIVITESTEEKGQTYYNMAFLYGPNEEHVTEQNRRLQSNHSTRFKKYYFKGIVNPGESYIYFGELDRWADFSAMIPALRSYEEYTGMDFDNFAIKGYAEPKETIPAEPLRSYRDTGFSDPAPARRTEDIVDGSVAATVLMDSRLENPIEREIIKESTKTFPEHFDLRDRGVVTPVKYQTPWGTCWGFAAIAAAETSILSEMGKTYEETGLDLSEHHLAYFARTPIDDGSSQDGEGVYVFVEDQALNTGAMMFTATSLFSSGIGVATESIFPYRGKNSLTETRDDGYHNGYYSPYDDWSIDSDYRFYQAYQLENSDILPSPAVYSKYYASEEGLTNEQRAPYYEGYDQRATDIMKEKLMEGKAISLGIRADTSRPGQNTVPVYINPEDNLWAHYTYDSAEITHAVTIVGWDDNFKATNFLDHTNDEWGDGLPHQPEGDGAWIVKNSWGSAQEPFPNYSSTWGITDENGKSTGYFYLSYYDRSISLPEVFDFDVSGNERVYVIDQYDYMPQDNVRTSVDSHLLKRANVFTAEQDQTLFAVSCENALGNADVKYEIYLLDPDAVTPSDGTLKATIERHYDFPGFHREYIGADIPVKAGEKYSIVITESTEENGDTYYNMAFLYGPNEEHITSLNRQAKYNHSRYIREYYMKGIVNPGESYIYLGQLDGWADFSTMIPALQSYEDYAGMDFDNFAIKGYAEPSETIPVEPLRSYRDAGFSDPAPSIRIGALILPNLPYIAIGVLAILVALFIILYCREKKKK